MFRRHRLTTHRAPLRPSGPTGFEKALAAVTTVFVTFVFVPVASAQTGSISASPNPCSISPGQTLCTSTLTWSSQGAALVAVFVNGTLFAESGGGGPYVETAPWIQAGASYVFTLYNYSGGNKGAAIQSVTVTGINVSLTCGTTKVFGDPAMPGNSVTLDYLATGLATVSFQITGATTNPSVMNVSASLQGLSPLTYQADVDTENLLGEYRVTPILQNGNQTATCTGATESSTLGKIFRPRPVQRRAPP